MKEFQWKDNFINQDNKCEHINKYVLLLLMLKIKCCKTNKLEETSVSLRIQDFSVYEEFLIKNILQNAEHIKEQSKLLHNQPVFKDIVKELEIDKPLKVGLKTKKILFYKFSKYVNLKDLHNEYKASNFFSYGLISLFILLIVTFLEKSLWPFLFFNFIEVIYAKLIQRSYKGKCKTFFFNSYRINNELCLIELQNELEKLERILEVTVDPYKNESFDDCYEKFKEIYGVSENFIEICKDNNIIDENNFVNSKYNHFLIQYLKNKRKEIYRKEKFDWQLINHVIIFDISKSRKSEFLKEEFKKDSKNNSYYSREGKKFQDFLNLFE